jgi:type II secretory pathway pseudopilin PulG
LVELLAVVAMIGILSTLAIVGYRKYLGAAKSGDAKAILSAVRIAQDNYRAETLSYLNCSDKLQDYYPASPNGVKRHWINKAHKDYAGRWGILNVQVDSPTTFGFALVAGVPGDVPPQPDTTSKPTWPTTTEPWYVVQAAGDSDADTVKSYFVSSSFSGEIYVENESE